ncbi:esterase family protein [Enterobacteriaceae bacterium BIT-l23]|uniref:esterase family protein n=1 Tax=Jejubacter sp. L23 TaxID=3092086 RepID=UPI001584FD10|nr:esterase family protein [Enterobacteriaceae bacterium BIT-l23]
MRQSTPAVPDTITAAARILEQLAAGGVSDSAQFWHDVESVTLPLVIGVAGQPDQRDVTFVWRSAASLQGVYLRLNRITDKERVGQGLMNRLPSSDIWWLTLRLPASYCGSYTMTEIPPDTAPEALSQLGTRFTPFTGQPDSLNRQPGIRVRGGGRESVLALDLAPAQEEWRGDTQCGRGELVTWHPVIAGQTRRVRLYLPDVPDSVPLGLLVLPDAETWFDYLGVSGAIDAAIDSGRIAPLAVLGIDNVDETERSAILGGRSELVQDIAERLIPGVRAKYPDRAWAGRAHTVLAGQSLGGVTALMAARHAPETFGAVLCHSPSMWWTPDGSSRPSLFSERDDCWVSEHLLSSPPDSVRIRLCVGSLEGSTVPHVRQLHQRLCAAGVESHCVVYTGGHDYAWWRGALIDGIAWL